MASVSFSAEQFVGWYQPVDFVHTSQSTDLSSNMSQPLFASYQTSTSKFSFSGDLLSALSSLLSEMCMRNDPLATTITKFHSIIKPDISILEYISRLRRYSSCSDTCFIAAVIYLDLAQQLSGIFVDSLNVHRLLVTCVMVASKFFDDKCQRNIVYAEIGGLSLMELNQLEVELLKSIHFNLNITPEQFELYETALMMRFIKLNLGLHPAYPIPPPSSTLSSPQSRVCNLCHSSSCLHSRCISPSSSSETSTFMDFDASELSYHLSNASSPNTGISDWFAMGSCVQPQLAQLSAALVRPF